MTNHTPGPWTTVYQAAEQVRIDMPGQTHINRNGAYVQGGNRDVNARLIAAAPDLLVALEKFMPYTDGIGGYDDEFGSVKIRALAAIAKATESQ